MPLNKNDSVCPYLGKHKFNYYGVCSACGYTDLKESKLLTVGNEQATYSEELRQSLKDGLESARTKSLKPFKPEVRIKGEKE